MTKSKSTQTSNNAQLEHANITLDDPNRIADLLSKLFDWKVRWSGESMNNGYTVHVGSDQSYIALYTNGDVRAVSNNSNNQLGHLNHIGVEVNDLDKVRQRAVELGYEPFNFGDYEPGQRFYINATKELEIEVVSYV